MEAPFKKAFVTKGELKRMVYEDGIPTLMGFEYDGVPIVGKRYLFELVKELAEEQLRKKYLASTMKEILDVINIRLPKEKTAKQIVKIVEEYYSNDVNDVGD